MNTETDKPAPKSVEEQLLLLLARQAKRVPFPIYLISATIAGLAAQHLPPTTWLPWLGLVTIVLLVRGFVLPRLPKMTGVPLNNRLRIAIVLSAVNGMVHGTSLAFFLFLPEFERALQTMLLVGLCTGAVATTAGYRPIFFAFLLPILPPLILLWAWTSSNDSTGWVNISVALLVALFGAILVALAKDSSRLFRESFELGTQKDELNRELRTAVEETSTLNKQLRTALAEADAAGRAKTRFLAAASHDLRQPLHTLSLYGAALAVRPLDDRSRDIAQQMDVALQALASQFDALLDISRLDAGVVEVNLSTMHLRSTLERARLEFEPIALEKGLMLTLDCPDDTFVRTDEALFERIIVNLLSNAVKYTDLGRIDVVVNGGPDACVVGVCDTGRGIPETELEHVFEEFYQLSNPHRDRKEGFGLGLSIVKRLADLLKLDVKIESEVGVGTKFYVRLPSSQDVAVESAVVGDDVSLTGLHVLAVDDEADVALATKILLEELGCVVTVVDSTVHAVEATKTMRPDIMLVDFRLRDGDDGLTTVRAIREQYPSLPAIMISGDTAPDRLREANEAGLELLHKPIVVGDLKQAIAKACLQ